MLSSKFLEKTINAINKLQTIARTSIHKHRFHSFGRKSKIGKHCRFIGANKIIIAEKVTLGHDVWLNAGELKEVVDSPTLTIGNGVYISARSHINAFKQVQIDDHVLIAENVYIGDTDHNYTNHQIPIIQQGWDFNGPIHLKTGCFIARGAVILAGVTIGKNSVVGANAVVTSDVPDNFIARGIPAKNFEIK
jgi:acetyltransferase-like isoleucine patch superfamily enzyme